MFSIGQVAKITGLSIETLRFYERSGLIPDPPRKESGYRRYPDDIILVLKFIKSAKELGFTLSEIKELMSLRCSPDATKAEVREKTIIKIAQLDKKIQMLQRMKESLEGLVKTCDGIGPASECPILDAMTDEAKDISKDDLSKKMMCHHYAGK